MLSPHDIAPETLRPLRRPEYEQMVALGIFEGERVELLYGAVVRMSPHGPPHDSAVERLTAALVVALSARATVRIQSAFAASDGSEPEPDVAVVPRRDYSRAHPTEAWLVIEVAESSLDKDRGVKAKLYAESGAEEYWVVDLVHGVVIVHTQIEAGLYGKVETKHRGERVVPVRFPDWSLGVDDILG